ncbi:glycosyltransferase [Pseudobutyrivibrio xylanivorans]|uniref:Glycosyl transferase family 4 n=1 Tax=Pseudobutyrivibrio xylanivorans TaxID=185007 RepID=A0A5P6VMX1_PSEXY|nr:glycosyltransferase [Pseudobutyrivibrio xylanivorans]QFJ54003.1 glycosyl transferase family 4 [Pseudobutyrivibrio xylanivorans]
MILHVIKSNIYSGAENVVCQIIKGLSGHEEFIYMAPHGPIEDKLKSIGLYDCYRGIDALTISEIKKAVDELQPTVVQAHDFTASVLCGFALKGRVPVISHIHCNPLWLKNPLHPNSISYMIASRWFSQIIAVSDAVANEYVYSGALKCPITTLGNPFSVKQVLEAGETASAGSSDILYVGRFNEAKNPLGAIKIFEAIPYHDDLTFRMVGNGELLDECQAYATSQGLNVHFEGFQDNVYKYMKTAKLLLMPSIFEGFGLVALEAMSLGKPVVCSGVGGLSDIINDSCGYICCDTTAYVNSIDELLSDSGVYEAKSRTAKLRAASFDNLDTYCKNILAIYKSFS